MSVKNLSEEQILNLALLNYAGKVRVSEGEESAKRINDIRLALLEKNRSKK